MKKSIYTVVLFFLLAVSCVSCLKKRKYNNGYGGDREYTLSFDHLEVVSEAETANVNGKLNVLEKATLNVYLKNDGPDPCMISHGTFDKTDLVASNGFYITNVSMNEVFFGSTGEEDNIQYIKPGETDYIALKVRTYDYLTPHQDVQLYLDLIDFDEDTCHIDFSVHIE